ncbi:MAG: hypothetical protein AAB521_01995 [Patescibacteria group bacterium]
MIPKYDLDKIKFATDPPTFQKAVDLYERGCVTEFKNQFHGYSAVVIGSRPYHVFVSSRSFDIANCTCYLGVNDTLCKHMVSVAIHAVKNGKILTDEDKLQKNQLIFSGRAGNLTKAELSSFKKEVTGAVRYIKPYLGPSRIWFSYQNSLEEGCNRLSALLSELPAGKQTAQLTVDLLLRLDKKLSSGGVDDSDGTVGGFIEEAVRMLLEFEKIDTECKKEFKKLKGTETSFGWEEPLLEIL